MHVEYILDKLASTERPSIVMTIGVAGSGKSTVLEKLQDSLQHRVPLCIISADEIRDELSGTFKRQAPRNPELSRKAWQEAYARVETAVSLGKLVIVDGTHLDEYRNTAIGKYRAFGAKEIIALIIDVPIEIAKARNETRGAMGGGYVDPQEIERMEAYRLDNPVTPETPGPFDTAYVYIPDI